MSELKHPFGFRGGERVAPAEVGDGETAECPAEQCGERLHVRGPSIDGTARHFWHPNGGGGPGGAHDGGGIGESALHRYCKSHAASALLHFFGEFIEESTTKEIFEQNFEIGDTGRRRQADARVTFELPHWKLGNGVIIEVQHQNKDKDIDAVTADYLAEEYSVFWTDVEEHYDGDEFLFDADQLEAEAITVWPNAVPEPDEWETVFPDIRCFTIDARGELVLDYPYRNEYGQIEVEKRVSLTRAEYPRWRAKGAYDSDFSRPYYSTSVQLPREFYEDRARETFRETPWGELFSGYEWDARTSLPMPDGGAKRNQHVDAVLLGEWAKPSKETTFRDTPWEDLFPGDEYPVEQVRAEDEAMAAFPERWLLPAIRDEIVDSLDAREVPHPGQQWHVAKRCLKEACLPGEHDWIDLIDGWEWRECRNCGLNDATWDAVYGNGVSGDDDGSAEGASA